MSRVQPRAAYRISRQVKEILRGECARRNFLQYGDRHLELMLQSLLTFCTKPEDIVSADGVGFVPEWWPTDVTICRSIESMRLEACEASLNWTSIMRDALLSCVEFHRKFPMHVEIRAASPVRRGLKRKYDSIDESVPVRHPQLLGDISNIMKTNSNAYAHKKLRLEPVVHLQDILKPPKRIDIVDKPTFMDSLQLASKSSAIKGEDTKPDTGLRKYSCNIPFSSDMGKILVQSERYTLSKKLLLRKIERNDYYLQPQPAHLDSNKVFETTYRFRKKGASNHLYKFPTRQVRAGRNYLEYLKRCLSKECSVPIERLDMDEYFRKKYKTTKCNVILERLNFD